MVHRLHQREELLLGLSEELLFAAVVEQRMLVHHDVGLLLFVGHGSPRFLHSCAQRLQVKLLVWVVLLSKLNV